METAPEDENQVIDEVFKIWKSTLEVKSCPDCNNSFLIAQNRSPVQCPNCGMERLSSQSDFPFHQSPELILPFRIKKSDLLPILGNFSKDIWFRSDDFDPQKLFQKVEQVYLPMWLVDCGISGIWSAEVGFNYQVKSSKESFHDNQWQTNEIIENRVRWEPRLGQINRQYHQTILPALKNWAKFQQLFGKFSLENFLPYEARYIENCIIRLPDYPPHDAWPIAQPLFIQRANNDCQLASGAEHIRNFTCDFLYNQGNWSEMLFPVFVTSYKNDDDIPQMIFIHGTTGAIEGRRYSSQRKGWIWAGLYSAISILIFVISLVLFGIGTLFPPALVLGILSILISAGLLIFAMFAVLWPWQWNRKQQSITDRRSK